MKHGPCGFGALIEAPARSRGWYHMATESTRPSKGVPPVSSKAVEAVHALPGRVGDSRQAEAQRSKASLKRYMGRQVASTILDTSSTGCLHHGHEFVFCLMRCRYAHRLQISTLVGHPQLSRARCSGSSSTSLKQIWHSGSSRSSSESSRTADDG